MKIAIVHERFTEFAGSEQVVGMLAATWPQARVYAPIVQQHAVPADLRDRITGTPLSKLVSSGGAYAHLLPLLPVAMRTLRLGRPDVVVASHHAFANQVVHAPGITDVPVVSYVHSPARWVWDPAMRSGEFGGRIGNALLSGFAAAYRQPDRRAAGRVTSLVANSRAVADRIARWWELPARVVHPPVDVDFYSPDGRRREDFFLLAGRLVPYKRPSVAIRAAQAAGVRLVVAGDGRMRSECEELAGPNVTFVGRVDDDRLRELYRRCSALLMPGVEDFGIIPVEAQATGAPVVATGVGGALDTVIPGRTGVLVGDSECSENELEELWTTALRDFSPGSFAAESIRAHAESFSAERFRASMRVVVEHATGVTASAPAARGEQRAAPRSVA